MDNWRVVVTVTLWIGLDWWRCDDDWVDTLMGREMYTRAPKMIWRGEWKEEMELISKWIVQWQMRKRNCTVMSAVVELGVETVSWHGDSLFHPSNLFRTHPLITRRDYFFISAVAVSTSLGKLSLEWDSTCWFGVTGRRRFVLFVNWLK